MAGRVEEVVKREFGVRFWNLKPEDEIRCLRLQQWEEKYRVPLDFILRTIVPVWKKKFARYSQGAFGVKIPTLVGKKSEEILKERLKELYPDGENHEQRRAQEQQRQWNYYREGIRVSEDWITPIRAAKRYQERMAKERLRRSGFEKQARKRPYRGNPWVR